MRLRLEASPDELRDKGAALVEALAHALFPVHPELAEQLEKALPRPEPSLKYPSLRELHARTARAYCEQLDAMLRDVGEVLDEVGAGVAKSEAPFPDAVGTEVEIEPALGEALYDWLVTKGGGHKYVRRVPTGKKKPRYRYYYDVTGGTGLGSHAEIQIGAKFSFKQGDTEGHFEVLGVQGDTVTLRHDESGKETTLGKKALAQMLHREHIELIQKKLERTEKDWWRVRLYGSEKQVGRLKEERERWRAMFPEQAARWYREPRAKPADAPAGYDENHDAIRALFDLHHGIFSLYGYEWPKLGEKLTPPPGLQTFARETLRVVQEHFGLDPDKPAREQPEAIDAARKKIAYVLGPEAVSIGAFPNVLGDVAGGEEVDATALYRLMHTSSVLTEFFSYKLAKLDLAYDAREEMSPEGALFAGKLLARIRKSYYEHGRGSRNGFNALRDMLGQVRTKRGVAAVDTLLSPMFDKGRAMASAAARKVLEGHVSGAVKDAEKEADTLRRYGWESLAVDANEPVEELDAAIDGDSRELQRRAETLQETLRGDPRERLDGRLVGLHDAVRLHELERRPEFIGHRFNNLPESESKVKQLFCERFGVRVVLEDNTFDEFVSPNLQDDDYRDVYLHDLRYDEKRLKDVRSEHRAKAKRWLAMEREGWGYNALTPEINEMAITRGQKAAANEWRQAVEMSAHVKRQALRNLYRALENMEEALGTKIDLSGIPLVISDRFVGAGASAHYMPSFFGGGIGEERLEAVDLGNMRDIQTNPHLSVGMGYEKSLAHEIMHYLDNRVMLRHAGKKETGVPLRVALAQWFMDRIGVTEEEGGIYAPKALEALGDTELGRLYEAVSEPISAKGDAYVSNFGSWLVRNREKPVFQTADGKALFAHMEQSYRQMPGGDVMLELHRALWDAGVYERYAKLDAEPDPFRQILADLSKSEPPSGEQALYWQMGTEVLARVCEQYVHHKLADKGKLSPTLTHLVYDEESKDGFGTPSAYIDPDVFRKRIAPAFERLTTFFGEHMTKSLKGLSDHTKPIAEWDAAAYERIKEVLRRKGYTDADFEEGGRLYGKSVNELLDRARQEGTS